MDKNRNRTDERENRAKKRRKRFFKGVTFTVLTFLMAAYLITVFSFPSGMEGDYVKERYNCFYSQEENTIDGVYIGASGVDRFWVAPQAYKDTGITVFAMSSSSMPLVTFKYMIEEVRKTQDPKVIILDIRSAHKTPEDVDEAYVRRVTDNMKLSKTRQECVDASLEYLRKADNEIDEDDPSWYFGFLKYHSRWKGDMQLKDFIDLDPKTDYMGYSAHLTHLIFNTAKISYPPINEDRTPIDPDTEDVLRDLCEYINTLDCNVVFVESPNCHSYETLSKRNYAEDIVRSYGIDVISCKDAEYAEMGLDFETDLYNEGHTNIVGAIKYTRWLANELIERYDLPDRRGDDKYKAWESAYDSYVEQTEEGKAELEKRIAEVKGQ